jgi:hypothetical protein
MVENMRRELPTGQYSIVAGKRQWNDQNVRMRVEENKNSVVALEARYLYE